jgi:serine-type anaerobic sulfatase-maturating enzyme
VSVIPALKPPPFSLLAKPTGATCNLACKSCFYLGKEGLYPGSNFRMPDKVLKVYLRQLLNVQERSDVCVSWQGGEPTLMGLDFFQRSIELVRKYKRPGQRVEYTLQTNGILLNDNWCAFFKEHNFLIGLSLDGIPEMHNLNRVNKAGQGSFDQVKRSWDLLQKHNVDTNILCAVHAANAYHPQEVYRFFRDKLHARYIQFIPIVERVGRPRRSQANMGWQDSRETVFLNNQEGDYVSQRSVKPGQYGTFLINIFDEWVHHDVGTVFVQAFDSALTSWCHLPASVCIFQEVCGSSLVLEHNGDLYSCDHFVEPGFRLGNILEKSMLELVSAPEQRQFGLAKRDHLPAYCKECDVLFACHGECPRNRFILTPDGTEEGLNYLCSDYKLFFKHINRSMKIMAALLQHGRSAAEIMQMI